MWLIGIFHQLIICRPFELMCMLRFERVYVNVYNKMHNVWTTNPFFLVSFFFSAKRLTKNEKKKIRCSKRYNKKHRFHFRELHIKNWNETCQYGKRLESAHTHEHKNQLCKQQQKKKKKSKIHQNETKEKGNFQNQFSHDAFYMIMTSSIVII